MRHVYYIQDYRIDWTPDGRRCDVTVRGQWRATFNDGTWVGELSPEVVARAMETRP
jgi:hypothetical protein